MARGTDSIIIEKTTPEKIRVVFYNVGSILIKFNLTKFIVNCVNTYIYI
jgi:hypothetical protein